MKIILFMFLFVLFVGCNGGGGSSAEILVGGNSNPGSGAETTGGTTTGGTTTGGGASITCPDGYILISHNADVGTTKDFCVMQYEARDSGSNLPVSIHLGLPWTNLSIIEAAARCNSLGEEYDLISNPEWMTIARLIENDTRNRVNPNSPTSPLLEGNYSASLLESAIGVDPRIEESEFRAYSRTYYTEGEIHIWDFAGNAPEFVDWRLQTGLDYYPKTNFCDSKYEYEVRIPDHGTTAVCPDYDLLRSEAAPLDPGLNSAAGVGMFRGPKWNTMNPSALRGGGVGQTDSTIGGIYSLNLAISSGDRSIYNGFRCVYRPN